MFGPVVTAALALVIATGAAPATARASWGHPKSKVSGGMRVTWTSDSGDTNEVGSTLSHADGVVRYTIIDRAIGNSAVEDWVPGELPSWADKRVGNGFLMRATLDVDRFDASARTVCDGGQTAEVTTRVTGIPQPHALLATEEPTVDLVRGHGTVDLDLPFLIHRDGVIRLGQVVVGTGAVELTTTGTVCSTDEDGAPVVVAQDPSVRTLSVADLMGAKVVSAVDDGFQRMAATVARDGSLTLAPKPRTADQRRQLPAVRDDQRELRAAAAPRRPACQSERGMHDPDVHRDAPRAVARGGACARARARLPERRAGAVTGRDPPTGS